MFLLEMILIQNNIYKPPGVNFIFFFILGLMCISIVVILNRLNYIPWQILFFVGLLWVYYLLFDITSFSGLLYLLSKTVVLLFLSYFAFSLIVNKDWYVFNTIRNLLMCLMFISIIRPEFDGGRATGLFTNANELGAVAAITLLFVLSTPSKLLVLFPSALLCILVILLTQSRAALVCAVIVFLLSNRISKKLKMFIIVMSIVILTTLTLSIATLDRFNSGIVDSRINEWQVAYYVISEHPFLGSGLASYDGVSRLHLDVYKNTKALGAHNGYLSLFIMIGIPASILLILVLFSPLIKLFNTKLDKQSTLYMLSSSGCVLMFIVGMAETIFTGVNSFSANLYLFLYILFLYHIKYQSRARALKLE